MNKPFLVAGLRAFKPRKAKYGFKCSAFRVDHICPVAKMIGLLNTLYTDRSYSVELQPQMSTSPDVFAIYTDNETIEAYIQELFAEPL